MRRNLLLRMWPRWSVHFRASSSIDGMTLSGRSLGILMVTATDNGVEDVNSPALLKCSLPMRARR